MINSIIFQGRLAKDPIVRYTQNQTPVCSFTLINNNSVPKKKGDGWEWEQIKISMDCVAWKSNANFVNKYFSKGQECLVEGKISFNTWKGSDGVTRYKNEIKVDKVHFCGPKPDARGIIGTDIQTDDEVYDVGEELPKDALPERNNTYTNADFVDIADEGELPF